MQTPAEDMKGAGQFLARLPIFRFTSDTWLFRRLKLMITLKVALDDFMLAI